jgi:hypothetical protein
MGDGAGGRFYFEGTPPEGAVIALVTASSGSALVTTSMSHKLANGQRVMIAGVQGFAAANGVWSPITVHSTTTFSFPLSTSGSSTPNTGTIGDGGVSFPSSALSARWLRADLQPMTPRMFGAIGDSTTDDLPAFNAMLLAIGTAFETTNFTAYNSQWEIFIPPGNYRLSGPLHLVRTVHLYGTTEGQWAAQAFNRENVGPAAVAVEYLVPATTLNFDPGWSGLIVEASGGNWPGAQGSNLGQATYSLIENLSIFGGFGGTNQDDASGVPVWHQHTHYNAGDIVIPSYFVQYGYAYRAHNAGYSGATEPAWDTADFPNPPFEFSVVDGINPVIGSEPILWELIQAHGIVVNALCTVRNCRIQSFAGNGVHMCSLAPTYASNGSRFYDLFIAYNGGSAVAVAGRESSGNVFWGIVTEANGGFGIWDQADNGNTHIGHQSSGNRAGSYWILEGTIIQPYAEAGQGPMILGSGGDVALIGGNFGADGFLSGDYRPDWQALQPHGATDVIYESTSRQYWQIFSQGTPSGSIGSSGPTRPDFTTWEGSSPIGRFNTSVPANWHLVEDGEITWQPFSEAGIPVSTPLVLCQSTGRIACRPFQVLNALGHSGSYGLTGATQTSLYLGGMNEALTALMFGSAVSASAPWAPNTAFTLNQLILGNGYAQKVIQEGTSGLAEPAWSSENQGITFDSTVIWACLNPDLFRLMYDPTNLRWYLTYTTTGGYRLMEFTQEGATPEGVHQVNFPNGLWLQDAISMTTGTGPPDTAGPTGKVGRWLLPQYPRGAIIWNSNPSIGGPPGWMCVESGPFPVWAAMPSLVPL